MAKTQDAQLCRQYLVNYVENIKKQIQQCQIELAKQSETYSITVVSLIQLDQCLKDYVDCQRKYLRGRSKHQLIKFKESLSERDSFKLILNLTTDHHVSVTRFLLH